MAPLRSSALWGQRRAAVPVTAQVPHSVQRCSSERVWIVNGPSKQHNRTIHQQPACNYHCLMAKEIVVMEYVTERLVNQAYAEILGGELQVLRQYALVQASLSILLVETAELVVNDVFLPKAHGRLCQRNWHVST